MHAQYTTAARNVKCCRNNRHGQRKAKNVYIGALNACGYRLDVRRVLLSVSLQPTRTVNGLAKQREVSPATIDRITKQLVENDDLAVIRFGRHGSIYVIPKSAYVRIFGFAGLPAYRRTLAVACFAMIRAILSRCQARRVDPVREFIRRLRRKNITYKAVDFILSVLREYLFESIGVNAHARVIPDSNTLKYRSKGTATAVVKARIIPPVSTIPVQVNPNATSRLLVFRNPAECAELTAQLIAAGMIDEHTKAAHLIPQPRYNHSTDAIRGAIASARRNGKGGAYIVGLLKSGLAERELAPGWRISRHGAETCYREAGDRCPVAQGYSRSGAGGGEYCEACPHAGCLVQPGTLRSLFFGSGLSPLSAQRRRTGKFPPVRYFSTEERTAQVATARAHQQEKERARAEQEEQQATRAEAKEQVETPAEQVAALLTQADKLETRAAELETAGDTAAAADYRVGVAELRRQAAVVADADCCFQWLAKASGSPLDKAI